MELPPRPALIRRAASRRFFALADFETIPVGRAHLGRSDVNGKSFRALTRGGQESGQESGPQGGARPSVAPSEMDSDRGGRVDPDRHRLACDRGTAGGPQETAAAAASQR